MLHLNDVTLRIAGQPLLEAASLHIPAGARMALVGRNGTGKSTLLRLIAGELQPDAGSVRLQAVARVGMVAQEAPGGKATPLEAVLAADRERSDLLAEARTATDPHRIGEIHNRLAEIGAEAAPARAARILKGLGFDDAAQVQPLSSFSGGWRMRVALAAVLFLEPDLLLLDEPTNHLDLEAALWLEEHLRRYPRTLLLVSHDRDFLNTVAQKVCHLEGRRLTVYNGNYNSFERQRREKLVLLEKTRAKQEQARAHIQSFIDRFRYKASKARQAQSRIKMLERMQPLADMLIEPDIVFTFPAGDIPSPPLVTMEGASAGYGSKVVLSRLELRLDPDDRIALLGKNGNGKSTLAKLLAGRLEPIAGTLTRARGLKVGFFAQHQIEDLDPEANSLEHLQRLRPSAREQELRERLAQFGLGAEKVRTKAVHLSGGEKTRLSLCLMCLEPPHILILDEPTNHLDIDSREALIDAVNTFAGAVIVISHDRHLVELTADRLWLVADGRVGTFEGDVEDYRKLLLETSGDEPSSNRRVDDDAGSGRLRAAERRSVLAPLRKRAKDAERTVERLSAEKASLEATLAHPETWNDREADPVRLQRRVAELSGLIEQAEARWLAAEAEIEEIDVA